MDLEDMAAALEASDDYRVLRKIKPRSHINDPDGTPTRTGLFVDVETTGLDPERHEIIELAMVPFTYGVSGLIFEIGEPFQALRQPSEPISPEITALTGIDDSMVEGCVINVESMERCVESADLVIAHNANFDRKFLERFNPIFEFKPWACTSSQIDWRAEGFEGTRLAYLVAGAGLFYDRHRALNDCRAAIELLATPLPKSGRFALQCLLERAREAAWRIFASFAPFELKDALRARGYRWNGDGHGPLRAWFIDVSDADKDAEIAFLEKEVFNKSIDLPVRRIDAYNRFSSRI